MLQTAGPQCPGVCGVCSCACVTDWRAAVPWCVWGVQLCMCYRLPGRSALVCVGCVAVCVLQTAGPQCPGVCGVCCCVCYRLPGRSVLVCVVCVAVCVTDCRAAVPWCVWGV